MRLMTNGQETNKQKKKTKRNCNADIMLTFRKHTEVNSRSKFINIFQTQ